MLPRVTLEELGLYSPLTNQEMDGLPTLLVPPLHHEVKSLKQDLIKVITKLYSEEKEDQGKEGALALSPQPQFLKKFSHC